MNFYNWNVTNLLKEKRLEIKLWVFFIRVNRGEGLVRPPKYSGLKETFKPSSRELSHPSNSSDITIETEEINPEKQNTPNINIKEFCIKNVDTPRYDLRMLKKGKKDVESINNFLKQITSDLKNLSKDYYSNEKKIYKVVVVIKDKVLPTIFEIQAEEANEFMQILQQLYSKNNVIALGYGTCFVNTVKSADNIFKVVSGTGTIISYLVQHGKVAKLTRQVAKKSFTLTGKKNHNTLANTPLKDISNNPEIYKSTVSNVSETDFCEEGAYYFEVVSAGFLNGISMETNVVVNVFEREGTFYILAYNVEGELPEIVDTFRFVSE